MSRSTHPAAWGQWLALLTLLVIAAQNAYLLIQGESFCPTSGCVIVEERSPLPPQILNGAGLAFFTLLFILLVWARRRDSTVAAALLSPFLLAGMAAEGVFLGFQYQTGSFCLYCCTVLAAVALLNVAVGWKQSLRALFVFAAVVLATVLLMVPKGEHMTHQPVDAGTFALKRGQGGEERYFFFSEDCAHCKSALAALMQDDKATLRLNPLASVQRLPLPGLEHQAGFAPGANRAFLAGLGIKTVPVLLVRYKDRDDMRVLLGEREIVAYVRGAGGGHPERGVSGQTQPLAPSTDFVLPGNDSCSVDTGCSQ